MTLRSWTRTLLLTVLALVAACSGNGKIAETVTADELFARGMTAYTNRKWTSAIETFERFVIQFPAHPRAQEARFRAADAYFGKKEFITAASEFSRLASDYPAGPYADDSRFRVCESYRRLSPKPQLDQQYTRGAIEHCQSLETYYPSSEFVPQAREILDALVNKLADKELRNAEFYYKRGAFDSAILYFEATARDFPTAQAAPKALLRLHQSYTTLGYKEEAEAAKAKLLADYPNSAEAKQLQAAPVVAK